MSGVLPRRLALRRQELEKVEDSITEFTQALMDTHVTDRKIICGFDFTWRILRF